MKHPYYKAMSYSLPLLVGLFWTLIIFTISESGLRWLTFIQLLMGLKNAGKPAVIRLYKILVKIK